MQLDDLFLKACQNGQKSVVITFLKKGGINVDKRDMNGFTPLHHACRKGARDIVRLLIENNADVNMASNTSITPLHFAAQLGNQEIIQCLLDAGADDSLKNVADETAAHIAVSVKGRFKKISSEDRVEMLKCLNHVDIPGRNGVTPLMTAQDYDLHASYILTHVFIEKGADVNRTDNNGNTALMLHAEWYCDREVFKAMVKAGYDVNARNKAGNTVLHYAMKNKSSEVAVYLIKKGADVNVANEKQETPMQIAVEKGMDEVLAFL